ncbi:MAG: ArsR/SmtB family transcription factor [Christensenellales bacterium]
MIHIQSLREGYPLFKALGSETRISILELLIEKGPMRMTAIAQELKITGGALTSHVKALHEAGILSIEQHGGRHGIQKICRVNDERIIIESPIKRPGLSLYEAEIDIGQFVDAQVGAPCGVATSERLLAPKNEPACFANPDRLRAGVLWMQKGYLEYLVPNFIKEGQKLTEIQISMELAPDVPTQEVRKGSQVDLSLGKKDIGGFVLPQEEGRSFGMFNPVWWKESYNQRGTLKLIVVNEEGSFVDGFQVSDIKLSDLKLSAGKSIPLRLTLPGKTVGSGEGITLFGRGFGSSPQGIKVRMSYEDQPKPKA